MTSSGIIEAGAFDKEALPNCLDCCGEQPQSVHYMINQPCSCLLSPSADDAVVQTCCRRVLRCLEVAFRLWDNGFRDSMLLLELTSPNFVNDVCQIEDVSQRTEEFSANDSLTAYNFEETLVAESELHHAETFASLCFPTPSSALAAVIIQYGQEAVAYFKFPFENLQLHAVFDPHPRSDHPSGPSISISWKPIDNYVLQIFASPIDKSSIWRIQRISSRAVPLPRKMLTATMQTTHRVSTRQVDLDQDALRKSASARTSWTLVESDPLLTHISCPLGPMPTETFFGKRLENMASAMERCGSCEENATNWPENETASQIECRRFSNINSQNEFSTDFLPGQLPNSKEHSPCHEPDEPTTPPKSPRSYRSSFQANVMSSPAWSNQSSSLSDDGDVFRSFHPPWNFRPSSSLSRSIANFNMDDAGFNHRVSVTGLSSNNPGKDGSSKEAQTEDLQASSLQRMVTKGHFTHSTIPRHKQTQKGTNLVHCSDQFKNCLLPGVFIARSFNEEFSPYTSAENLNPSRPASAPESDEMSSRAGPSRLSGLDSKWSRNSRLEREGPSCHAFSSDPRDVLTQQAISDEDWELALLRQLQEEEELAASVAHQISVDAAWIVKLQQFLEEQKIARGSASSRTSFELDRQLALELQQEEANVDSRANYPERAHESAPDTSNSSEPNGPIFECGICHERCGNDVRISVPDCGHSYCRECVGFLARAKIEDNRYPIICPDCLIDRSRAVKCQISPNTLQGLDLSPRELERLEELQTLSHSVVLECPKCNERININRPDYGSLKFIICEGRECGYKWCRDCLKPIKSLHERHRCKNENIERLMRRKGWKYCPGCRTPVLKESGCNHMTCSAPGCNAHFCYRCGVLIVDTTHGGDVGLTVTEHYANSKCRLFERRYCTIQ